MGQVLDNRYIGAIKEVYLEIARAKSKFPKDFVTKHHGYAVMLEEADEMWAAIKRDADDGSDIDNAVQVAAMAIRYAAEFGNYSKIAPGIERSGVGQYIEDALNSVA